MPKIATRPASYPIFPGLRWLPAPYHAQLFAFFQKCGALLMILVGVWLILAMASHHNDDPSWNMARAGADVVATTQQADEAGGTDVDILADPAQTQAHPQIYNLMGETGAFVGDLSWQFFGWAGFLVAISLASWGLAWWRNGRAQLSFWRVGLMLIGALLVAMALTAVPVVTEPARGIYGGGSLGALLFNPVFGALAGLLPPSLQSFGSLILATPLVFIGFLLWSWVSLLRWHHAAWLAAGGVVFFERVGGLFTAILPRKAKTRKAPTIRDDDDDAYDDDEMDEDDGPPFDLDDEDDDADAPGGKTARSLPVKSKPAVISRPAKTPASAKAPAQAQLMMTEPSDWELPPIDLLKPLPPKIQEEEIDETALRRNADMLQAVLGDYNVKGHITSIHPGPVVTLYELEPAPGTKSARVINLADDIARSMSAVSVRAAVVPGRNVIGIEIPNKKRQTVFYREMLEMDASKSQARLPLILGKDIGGEPIVADLARMPHLLVAGTTGSGKSVAVNTMILSLLYKLTPDQCRFIMIDPKMLELSVYDDIPHLLAPVVTEPGRAVVALKWVVREMENRYRAMSKLGVRNIDGYNARLRDARKTGEVLMRKVQTGYDAETGKPLFEDQALDLTELPYIVVIVDEFADLMLVAGKDVEASIQRLAQMARAAGIHLIMATQRPSVDVITGVIKANFPTRISFQVTSKIDSRTILGEGGAEQLLGMGDMLYMASGGKITRVHGPFVADQDVEAVVKHLRAQGEPSYIDGVTDDVEGGGDYGGMGGESGFGGGGSGDELYDRAVELVARERKASTSFIQRHLQIGYNRAATLIEKMEKEGVVGPANHVGKREVLVGDHSGY